MQSLQVLLKKVWCTGGFQSVAVAWLWSIWQGPHRQRQGWQALRWSNSRAVKLWQLGEVRKKYENGKILRVLRLCYLSCLPLFPMSKPFLSKCKSFRCLKRADLSRPRMQRSHRHRRVDRRDFGTSCLDLPCTCDFLVILHRKHLMIFEVYADNLLGWRAEEMDSVLVVHHLVGRSCCGASVFTCSTFEMQTVPVQTAWGTGHVPGTLMRFWMFAWNSSLPPLPQTWRSGRSEKEKTTKAFSGACRNPWGIAFCAAG